ncbi:MAG: DUF72 domain-containing protein [bacterium]
MPTEKPEDEQPEAVVIQVGTSGYYFKDWIGPFYPEGTKAQEMLAYYAKHFCVVEINMTYYSIPKPSVFAGMAAQVPDGFGFYVKVHQEVTHKREKPKASVQQLFQAVEPLRERGLLRGFLAQFPYSFKKNPLSSDYLRQLAEYWWNSEEPLFVEFRHTSWNKPIVFEFLTQQRLGFVNVDLPPLPRLPQPSAEVTYGAGYIRFHGRNTTTWWGKQGGLRYDYSYSLAELEEWQPSIFEMLKQARRVVIFMNNCHMGQAARNAKMMQDLFRETETGGT